MSRVLFLCLVLTAATPFRRILPPTFFAGRSSGALAFRGEVPAHGTDSSTGVFRGGEQAQVFVRGDGDTDLIAFVYDANGNLVTSDLKSAPDCVLRFVPGSTGRFTIVVRNTGGVYNEYVLRAH